MALLYLGLGSNLGNRKAILLQAIEELKKRIGTCQRLSAFYETAPWGFRSSHTFLNAVAAFYTELSNCPARDCPWSAERRSPLVIAKDLPLYRAIRHKAAANCPRKP